MKKNLITIKDFTTLQDKIGKAKKQLRNSLTEDADDLRKSLEALLDELANAEIEYDFEALKEAVNEMIASYDGEMPEEIANAIKATVKNAFVDMQKTMPQAEKLTPKIKNEISAAILRAKGKEDVKDAVDAVLTKNGITGLTFEATVDYAIADNWGESNRLFNALRKVPFTKFFYTTQDVTDTGVQAHEWAKTSDADKIAQTITAQGKSINTKYIYKRLPVAFEDLDDIEEAGEQTNFIRYVNEELDRQIINTVVAVLLANPTVIATTDITYSGGTPTIEPLAGAGNPDAWRTRVSVTAANAAAMTLADVRALSDAVPNPYGKAKWLVIDQQTFTNISKFKYASGGDDTYRSIDEMKGLLLVDEIYITSLSTYPIVFLPDGVWYKVKKSLEVAYPIYERNEMNYQKERNMGIAVHDLKSVAFPLFGQE